MARKIHPNRAIEAAVKYAESNGWQYAESGKSSHAWGFISCPQNSKQCRCGHFCRNSIWQTPKNADNEAKKIRRWVDNCLYSNRLVKKGPNDE